MERNYIKIFIIFSVFVIIFPFSNLPAENIIPPPEVKPEAELSSKSALSAEDKDFLLNLARRTLEQYLKEDTVSAIDAEKISPLLKEIRGCFVTLKKDGNLRGCIGYIQPRRPLCDCVMENAINAATRDGRFPKVGLDELGALTIEISVLTVPENLAIKNRNDLLNRLTSGRDGVILTQGLRKATFLPQVWEHFPDKESFLNALCQKGRMASGCWKKESTKVFTYQAEVFQETKK